MPLMGPMGNAGARRRGRRRGLVVGAAVGSAAARRNQPQPAEEPVAAAPAPAPQAAPADDSIEQLKKLAELRDQGILTEEEFAAKKTQILGL